MAVDETLTDTQFRQMWQIDEEQFRSVWMNDRTGFVYYMRNRGGQIVLGRAGPFDTEIPSYVNVATTNTSYFGVADFARAVAAINQFNVYRLRNPAGSGVNLFVTYMAGTHSAARRFAPQAPNSADAARTTNITPAVKYAATTGTNKGTFSNDNNVAANLTNAVHGFVLQANIMHEYSQPVLVIPGKSFDIQVGDITDAAGETSTFTIEWVEA